MTKKAKNHAASEISGLDAQTASAPQQVESKDADVCVAYTRSATTELNDQYIDCLSIAGRLGMKLKTIYSDLGETGLTVIDRPHLQRLIADARNGQFNHLIIADIDRIARDGRLAMAVIRQLLSCGVSVHTAKDSAIVPAQVSEAEIDEILRELVIQTVSLDDRYDHHRNRGRLTKRPEAK